MKAKKMGLRSSRGTWNSDCFDDFFWQFKSASGNRADSSAKETFLEPNALWMDIDCPFQLCCALLAAEAQRSRRRLCWLICCPVHILAGEEETAAVVGLKMRRNVKLHSHFRVFLRSSSRRNPWKILLVNCESGQRILMRRTALLCRVWVWRRWRQASLPCSCSTHAGCSFPHDTPQLQWKGFTHHHAKLTKLKGLKRLAKNWR